MASRIVNVLFLHFWIYVNLAVAQTSSNTKSVAVSEKSNTLCNAWLNASQKQSKDAHQDGLERESSLQKLLAQPDADLCLLAVIDNQGVVQGVGGDTAYWTALEELGKLNTDRSFDMVSARLRSHALFDRADAIEILCRFSPRPETISLLIDSLENDRSPIVKTAAANALRRCKDATAEPAFVRAVERREGAVPIAATGALAEMNSDAGVVPVVSLLLECNDERLLPLLFKALRGYRKKAIVEAMLEKWRSFEYRSEEVQTPADQNASLVMTDCFEATDKLCGPKPENHFREWQAWWMKVEPMLNEHLKVAEQYQTPPKDYATIRMISN